jgi:hypothetical protein
MAELKTKPTNKSVEVFLKSIEPEAKKEDAFTLLQIFKEATGEKPVMWGESIVGFGKYHYKSERSSQEGDWPLVGFSPRKQNLSIYVLQGSKERYKDILSKLGKHKTSVGCLYINKLSDVDLKVFSRLVKKCFKDNKKMLVDAKR